MANESVSFNTKLKKNDVVQIISGRDKGKSGKVLEVDRKHGKVIVEKVNLVKRHVKPSQKNPQGGILEKEVGIVFSKVMLFCAKCNKGVRFSTVVSGNDKDSKKTRVCKKCKSVL